MNGHDAHCLLGPGTVPVPAREHLGCLFAQGSGVTLLPKLRGREDLEVIVTIAFGESCKMLRAGVYVKARCRVPVYSSPASRRVSGSSSTAFVSNESSARRGSHVARLS